MIIRSVEEARHENIWTSLAHHHRRLYIINLHLLSRRPSVLCRAMEMLIELLRQKVAYTNHYKFKIG